MSSLLPGDINRATMCALRHYVSFSYYARSAEIIAHRGVAQPCVCSAFVMKVRGVWCLVTAGHVLDGIEAERSAGLQLVSFRLWDGWAVGAQHTNYVPFDFFELPKIRVNQDGLDYGLILLRPLLVENLAANGVVPVGEEQYERDWPSEFHAYSMVGTPGTTVRLDRRGDRDTTLTQSAWIMHLERIDDPPAELVQPNARFYARILASDESPEWTQIGGDISGMSGGPILGMRRDADGLHYWVVAVQSGWLASRRIIAACYFQDFARVVGKLMDDETAAGEKIAGDSD